MTLNEETNDLSAPTALRHSTRAFTSREVFVHILEAILKNATTASSWSNTHVFRLAPATGEHAQRLCEHYGHLFDEETKAYIYKAEDPTMEIPVPDGDHLMRKRYPDGLHSVRIRAAKFLYGIYGTERGDIEGCNRVNRHDIVAFDAPVMGFVFVHEDTLPWSAMGAGLMFQALSLSVKFRGVDSCPVGILTTWRELVGIEFKIPEHYRFIIGLTPGYAGPEAPISAMETLRPLIQLLDGK